MSGSDRFGSLKDESNPFKEQSRRNRGRGSQRGSGDERTNRAARRSESEQPAHSTRMAQTFGTYLEQQLGVQSKQQTNSAYVPPSRNRQNHTHNNARDMGNSFKSMNRLSKTFADLNDESSFPELKPSHVNVPHDVKVSTSGNSSGWQSNGVEMMSQGNKNKLVEEESDDVRPGWVRLSKGKMTYGPPSSNYERVIYNMLQARNSALNELRRRHELNRQYDYEMYGDRMLYEDRLGSFTDEEEEDEDDSSQDGGGSSSYDTDSHSNDGYSDDWY